MRLHRLCVSALLIVLCTRAQSSPPTPALFELSGDIEGVHDPAVIKADGVYYVFSTGSAHLSTGSAQRGHIPIRCSSDLRAWRPCGNVFDELPSWVEREIPGAKSLWAPDISFEEGEYRLYYAASTFGHNDSAIGLAVNRTLNPASNEYKWVDRGVVLRSHSHVDDWNAIDPNLVADSANNEWLVFGSFWSGIKMRRIDPATGLLSALDGRLYSLAERPHAPPQPDAIEAPFVIRHNGWFYLFVSFDFCCRGANSTYNVDVGRSRAITGPYLDAGGRPMLNGGGTRITESTPQWKGPGHEAVLLTPQSSLLFFHAYDAATGKPYLQIAPLAWKNDWPEVTSRPN